MPKKKEKHALPERAPKKSGKRGIGPIDPVADFDAPVTKPVEPKGSLLANNPPKPSVANGRFRAFYDKPFVTKVKDKILIALQITTPLEDEHEKIIPKIVADAFSDISKKGRTRINLRDIPAQHVTFFLTSDHKEDLITLPACKVVNANVAVIQRKGEGSTREVVRFSFRLQAVHSKELESFSTLNLANDFWLEMENSQEDLWDEGEG